MTGATELSTPVLRRYAQALLDRLLIVGLSLAVVVVLLAGAFVAIHFGAPGWILRVPPFMIVPAMLVGYAWTDLWWPHRRDGATPAMHLLGLRIVTEYGGRPTLRALLIRLLLNTVDGLFFGLVGVLLIAITERHQRVGDLVAHTLVIRVR